MNDQDDSIIGFIYNAVKQDAELLNKYYYLRDRMEMAIKHNGCKVSEKNESY